MTRNLKALGLALVAALAMSAVAASGASATPFHFGSDHSDHVILAGTQHAGEDVFTTDAGTVRCNTATYSGTINEADTATNEVSVTPAYSNCKAFGFINVPIHVNGCQYKFTAITKEGSNYEGKVDIVCPGNPISITAPGCEVTVGSQNALGSITYTNVGSGTTREVTVDVNISGIHYYQHDTGITCTTGTKTNGLYVGSGLVTGRNAAGTHVGLFVTP